MAYSCKQCGASLTAKGNKYECPFCGTTYEASDFAPKQQAAAAPVRQQGGADVFEQNIDGILELRWQGGQYIYSGSGFLISAGGYAITNTHVVTYENGRSCGTLTARLKGQEIQASVVLLGDDRHGNGSGVDLALIKLSRLPLGAKPLHFEQAGNVRNGEQVYVIGNSLGYGTAITSGIVSDRARKIGNQTYVMTDCATNGGNSGGPLFNAKGNVIGVHVSAQNNADGMKYAIPVESVNAFLEKARRAGVRL